ncbi:RimK/LysX family protein [Sulfurimonas sp. HSL3-7]|uniref:ATP-dependent zinc protease family protein n=1 Tax=Sulfonitrofixus jiaomeiensis TaxID=3131938 RepID=UPI0031F78F0A
MKKLTIGRNEYVSLPDLGFNEIDAKIDTGAYSCSIHCDEIRLNDDGTVHFRLLDDSHPDYHEKDIVMPVHEIRHVKSSNGTVQERIFIMTTLELFNQQFETELSLTDRASMKYPMLIGRKFLEDRFIVDVSLTYQSAKN